MWKEECVQKKQKKGVSEREVVHSAKLQKAGSSSLPPHRLSPPPGKVFSLSPSLALSGCLCSCGLLSVTSTQQVPLLEQKREKEEEGSCERVWARNWEGKPQECAWTHQRSISLTSQRGLRSVQTPRGRGGQCWRITAPVVLADHAERRRGNALVLLILVSLANAASAGGEKAVRQPGARQRGSILQQQQSVETAETCIHTHRKTHMNTAEWGRTVCHAAFKRFTTTQLLRRTNFSQENRNWMFHFLICGWMMETITSGEEIIS